MSEAVEVAVPENADAAMVEAPQEKAPEPVSDPLGDAGKRAIDRMKAERDAAKRELQQLRDRDLSELDLAKKQAADAAAELAEMRRQNAFMARGVPLDLIPPADSSPESFSAYAEALLAWKGTAQAVPAPVPQPKPDRSQGAQPVDGADAEAAAYEAIKSQNWAFLTNQPRR